jgi:hypothetical protein
MLVKALKIAYLTGRILVTCRALSKDVQEILVTLGLNELLEAITDAGQDL